MSIVLTTIYIPLVMLRIPYALFLAILLLTISGCSSPIQTPSEETGFTRPGNHSEILEFCRKAASASPLLDMDIFGYSHEERALIVMKASNPKAKGDAERLRVLLFAQQHGNEQSSKEGLLLLLRDIANGKITHLLDHMEIWIVPQVNPDGGEVNQRRNARGVDLNRDHVVKEATETRALHQLFRSFMPHVSVDIHEYQPYRQAWREFGGYKQFDMQVGVTTNINIDRDLERFSLDSVLPAIEKHLVSRGYSFHNYLVGPPPGQGITRHSTININDGRQSFGILNTLSFIYEGINGRDGFAENLERRSQCQLEALIGLLTYLNKHPKMVVSMVDDARNHLTSGGNEMVAVQTKYVRGDDPIMLPLQSSSSGLDTIVEVIDFHPLVAPVKELSRPLGYLLPKDDLRLMQWLDDHSIDRLTNIPGGGRVHAWELLSSATDNDFPAVRKTAVDLSAHHERYVYVPINQLHAHFLVLTLEPESEISLWTNERFQHLVKNRQFYPVIRVD